MLTKIIKKQLSSFLTVLTLFGSVGFSEADAANQVAKQYTPPMKRRKVEKELEKEELSTSDKVSIGALAVGSAVVLGAVSKFICDCINEEDPSEQPQYRCKKFHGGLPNGNNSCYINALIQVLYHSKFFYDYINKFDFHFLCEPEEEKLSLQNAVLGLREIFGYMDNHTAIENQQQISKLKYENLGHKGKQEDVSVPFVNLKILYGFLITSISVSEKNFMPKDFSSESENQDLDLNSNQYIVRLNREENIKKIRTKTNIFDENIKKIRTKINIFDEIVFNEEKFTLTSVIIHSGPSANSGHYYAYCMAQDGNWYRYDDRTVTQASYEQVKEEASTDGTYLVYTKTSELNSCLREAPQPLQ